MRTIENLLGAYTKGVEEVTHNGQVDAIPVVALAMPILIQLLGDIRDKICNSTELSQELAWLREDVKDIRTNIRTIKERTK